VRSAALHGRAAGQERGAVAWAVGPATEIVLGVSEDVGGDAVGPAGERVAADALVDGGDGGRRPLLSVPQRPPGPGQTPDPREQQLQQHPGRQTVTPHRPSDQRRQHGVDSGAV
jgi:hypothetical protein